MKKTLIIALFLAVVNLSGCATHTQAIIKPDLSQSAEKKRNMLIGKWFGEMISDKGEIQRWLVERYKDGTYKIWFRIHRNGDEGRSQTEVGHWGVAGPIYFSIMKGWIRDDRFFPSNPENPYYYDAYKIINLTDKSFIYYDFDEKLEFKVKKVDDNFQWPDIGS